MIGRFGTIDRFAEKYYDMTPYQYAANNPVVNIDVNGDSTWTTVRTVQDGANSTVYHTTHVQGKVLNNATSTVSAKDLAKSLNSRLNAQSSSNSITNDDGSTTTHVWNIQADYQAASSMDDVNRSDHLVVIVDNVTGTADPKLGGGPAAGIADIGGKVAYVEAGRGLVSMGNTAFHEVGHNLGLRHPDLNDTSNPMSYTGQGAGFSGTQLLDIYGYARSRYSNRGSNAMRIMNQKYFYNGVSSNQRPYVGMRKPNMIIPRTIPN